MSDKEREKEEEARAELEAELRMMVRGCGDVYATKYEHCDLSRNRSLKVLTANKKTFPNCSNQSVLD